MEVLELVINEEQLEAGVQAISLVADPAIESDWVALSKQKVALKMVNEEKRLLMGAALIPNKPIFRRDADDTEYNIYFSSKTVRQASELFLKKGLQGASTLEHEIPLEGNTVVESWIKEDDVNDKSVKYGLDAPVGTWLVSMKIDNDETWAKVKSGDIKGFSIEGYFTDQAVKQMSHKTADDVHDEIMKMQQEI